MKMFEYFLVGVFAALGALLLEIAIDTIGYQFGILDQKLFFLTMFVIIEELTKFIVIRKKIVFDNLSKTILANCFWIGLGFGLLELGIALLNQEATYAGNMSAILAVLLVHIATTLFTGLALVKLRNNGYYAILAVGPALILHLTFNYWALSR